MSNKIDTQAALWVERHRDAPLSPEDRQEFDAWVSADPRHRGAFVRLNAVRVDLDRLAALSAGRKEVAAESDARATPRVSRRWALAAGVAGLVAAPAAWLTWRSRGEAYVSGVGEMRQVSLIDGSSMMLNTSTEARVLFSDSQREVVLTKGEAHFEVAKDAARPFVVRFGGLSVTAVGTAFSVRVDEGLTDVTVSEGTVEIAQANSASAAADGARRVSANQRAIVASAKRVEVRPIDQAEVQRRLAWRQGFVAFDGEPLAEAVAEVNRHNRRRIVIEDSLLAGRPVVGMFRANDIDTFARTAAAAMNADIIEEGELIRLASKQAQVP